MATATANPKKSQETHQTNAITMPRQHHSVFRGWLRQSSLFERQLTGLSNLLTADQIRRLQSAGWHLERDGIWRDHLGGTYTEEQALAWLNSTNQS